mmetsp:Transcript_4080/g.8512  ORF Transcript_4080/g.8512 Transcript_4080/m.8512 type:complete len:252 (-) Transcript_4080:416-1171(-)
MLRWSFILRWPFLSKSKPRCIARACMRAYFSRTLTLIPRSFATVAQLTFWLCSLAISLYFSQRALAVLTIWSRSAAVDTTMEDLKDFFVHGILFTSHASVSSAADGVANGIFPGACGTRSGGAPPSEVCCGVGGAGIPLVISMGIRLLTTTSAARCSAASLSLCCSRSLCSRSSALRRRFASRSTSRTIRSCCLRSAVASRSRARCRRLSSVASARSSAGGERRRTAPATFGRLGGTGLRALAGAGESPPA